MNLISKKDFGLYLAVAGWLRIAYGFLFLLGGLFIGALIVGVGAATGDAVAFRILGTTGVVLGAPLAILSPPGIVAGVGLLRRARWSRVMALVLSAFDLLAFPIGTLLGAYTIFVLLQPAAVEGFEAGRSPWPTPFSAPARPG